MEGFVGSATVFSPLPSSHGGVLTFCGVSVLSYHLLALAAAAVPSAGICDGQESVSAQVEQWIVRTLHSPWIYSWEVYYYYSKGFAFSLYLI